MSLTDVVGAVAEEGAARASPAPAGGKTEGQQLLERLLAQCNRYNSLRRQVEDVRAVIAPGARRPPAPADNRSLQPANSFFGALNMIADGNDQVADELQAAIDDLSRLF